MSAINSQTNALNEVLAWLEDPRLGTWTYMEGADFDEDKSEMVAKIKAALYCGPADDANDAARWRWMMAHLGICEQMIKDTGDRTGDWAVMFRNRVDEQRSATEDDGK